MDKAKITEELSKVKSEKKELLTKEVALTEELLRLLTEEGQDEYRSKFGKVTIATRRTYMYSDAISKREENLKIDKYEEEQSGRAKDTISKHIRFIPTEN